MAYIYDVFNRKIGKKIDTNGDGAFERHEWFAYDGDQIALVFADLDGDGPGASSLTNRYMYGPAVDQVLADEQLNPDGSLANHYWPLADHEGTIRDIAQRDSTTGVTQVANHLVFDSFGNLASETNPAVDHLFSFTGRIWDADALLYDYRARWYDPAIGRFISEDPIEDDYRNLSRYVGNDPVNSTDPSGLRKSGFLGEYAKDVTGQLQGAVEAATSQLPAIGPVISGYHNYQRDQARQQEVESLRDSGYSTGAAIGIQAGNEIGEMLGSGDFESVLSGKNAAGDDLTWGGRTYRFGSGMFKWISTALGVTGLRGAGPRAPATARPPAAPRSLQRCPPGVVPTELVPETAPNVRTLTPVADPARPVYQRGHAGQPVVDHIRARAAGGHTTDPSNLHVKPWEWNARKGAYEGQLLKARQKYIQQGLTPAEADALLAPEWHWIENDVIPRPIDPSVLDRVPWPGSLDA